MSLSIPLAAGPSKPPTEASLFDQAQAGCRDSLDHLMAAHDGLVQAVVRRQVLGQLPFAEAVQAGRLGLWRAICGYDPQRGGAFSTYAWPAIQRQVWRAVQVYHRPPPPLAVDAADPVPDPALTWETTCVHTLLYDLVARLPTPRLRYIVVRRYGLAGQSPATYQQIGTVVGLSGERVRQLHTAALVWLRHPAHSQQLRSLLDRHTLTDYEAAEAQAQRWLRQRGGHHAG
jgi:RNA polymerase sigma factor (sigma-70 family)